MKNTVTTQKKVQIPDYGSDVDQCVLVRAAHSLIDNFFNDPETPRDGDGVTAEVGGGSITLSVTMDVETFGTVGEKGAEHQKKIDDENLRQSLLLNCLSDAVERDFNSYVKIAHQSQFDSRPAAE